jgi:mono/diheme cytochrome c family protein
MKKSVFALIAVSAVIFIAVVSFRPVTRVETPQSIPDSVFAVFDKSCVKCHAAGGNKMAMSKLNFDNWDSYAPEKKSAKSDAILKAMNKGSMPPSGFRKNNPNLVPTAADVKKVAAWAGTFSK